MRSTKSPKSLKIDRQEKVEKTGNFAIYAAIQKNIVDFWRLMINLVSFSLMVGLRHFFLGGFGASKWMLEQRWSKLFIKNCIQNDGNNNKVNVWPHLKY